MEVSGGIGLLIVTIDKQRGIILSSFKRTLINITERYFQMASRTGVFSIGNLAKKLCKAVLIATPAIKRAYPNNLTLLAALATANTACQLLAEEVDAVVVYGD